MLVRPEARGFDTRTMSLVEALQALQTSESLRAQLYHATNLPWLYRRYNDMELQNLIPSLLLRLKEDQRCYDFLKWWAKAIRNPDYSWFHADLPFLDT
ncbi:hypothetical protein N7462_004280 [Penicillium macrosclerotiorum]|uniref:uncharacterized protein n=1 Tax=Penicillium macrosclerotiorum TaxID=303699 RepID=UPI00254701DE|nr:uncharacterized protein N7462_004280 [Penicillium macrosclerotiorum]KAJ5689888.1 hypothetical protein N7462_004280 [Penicillium macrosclerotiorum]